MTPLFGHDEAVAAIRVGLDSGRLHHAWLLTGPRGVGKGKFARAAALRLLADAAGPKSGARGLAVDADHSASKLFRAQSHPDFRLVEREVWDSKGNIVPKDERGEGDELGRNIRIKQIRLLGGFFAMKPAFSDRRAVVIDAVDELEAAAANALLKSLEEPPAGTLFLLVSHAPDRLLPTIRSRCRQLRLGALGDDAMTAALRAALPEADGGEITALARAGEGSPGRALGFHGLDIGALDAALADIAAAGDPTNAKRVKLAASLSTKSAQARYEAFLGRAPTMISAAARERKGPGLAHALGLWERAQELAGGAVRLSLDPHSVVFELAGMVAGLAPPEARLKPRAKS